MFYFYRSLFSIFSFFGFVTIRHNLLNKSNISKNLIPGIGLHYCSQGNARLVQDPVPHTAFQPHRHSVVLLRNHFESNTKIGRQDRTYLKVFLELLDPLQLLLIDHFDHLRFTVVR